MSSRGRAAPKPCRETGCEYPKFAGKQRCFWHYALAQPIEWQVARADKRLAEYDETHEARIPRVPPVAWPQGERWCSGCQSFVPLFYCTGSRCKACASRAAHASHVAREYGIPAEDYELLLKWQGGKCYICRRVPRSRRLAVDHNHDTGEVRGLLCADNDRGCNHAIVGNLKDVAAARRLLQYLEDPPYNQMLRGDPCPIATEMPNSLIFESATRLSMLRAARKSSSETGSGEGTTPKRSDARSDPGSSGTSTASHSTTTTRCLCGREVSVPSASGSPVTETFTSTTATTPESSAASSADPATEASDSSETASTPSDAPLPTSRNNWQADPEWSF